MCVRSVASRSRTPAACVDIVRCTLDCGLICALSAQSHFPKHQISNRSVLIHTKIKCHMPFYCGLHLKWSLLHFFLLFSVSSMNALILGRGPISAHTAINALHTPQIFSSTFALTRLVRTSNVLTAPRSLSCTPTCRDTSGPMVVLLLCHVPVD